MEGRDPRLQFTEDSSGNEHIIPFHYWVIILSIPPVLVKEHPLRFIYTMRLRLREHFNIVVNGVMRDSGGKDQRHRWNYNLFFQNLYV